MPLFDMIRRKLTKKKPKQTEDVSEQGKPIRELQDIDLDQYDITPEQKTFIEGLYPDERDYLFELNLNEKNTFSETLDKCRKLKQHGNEVNIAFKDDYNPFESYKMSPSIRGKIDNMPFWQQKETLSFLREENYDAFRETINKIEPTIFDSITRINEKYYISRGSEFALSYSDKAALLLLHETELSYLNSDGEAMKIWNIIDGIKKSYIEGHEFNLIDFFHGNMEIYNPFRNFSLGTELGSFLIEQKLTLTQQKDLFTLLISKEPDKQLQFFQEVEKMGYNVQKNSIIGESIRRLKKDVEIRKQGADCENENPDEVAQKILEETSEDGKLELAAGGVPMSELRQDFDNLTTQESNTLPLSDIEDSELVADIQTMQHSQQESVTNTIADRPEWNRPAQSVYSHDSIVTDDSLPLLEVEEETVL